MSIKILNDNFRKTFTGGQVLLTAGIDSMSMDDFAKIVYYDLNYEFMSENPADPTKTTRILTIMLAEDW